MAWLESHQTLANHPKTLKLSRLLNVPRVTAVGHLHFLWWWALDYAQDGDLSKFDELDVAVAADWQGEPSVFWSSLIRAGFVDEDGCIHDWHEYAGRLIERRAADAARKRSARTGDVQRTSSGHPADGAGNPEDGVRNRTVPNRTEPNRTKTPPKSPSRGTVNASSSAPENVRVLTVTEKPPESQPYAAWAAFCEATGLDITAASPQEKGKSLKAAQRLLQANFTVEDIRGCSAYLASQSWRTSVLSMANVEGEIGKWSMAGKPASERSRASPNSRPGPMNGVDELEALVAKYRKPAEPDDVIETTWRTR